MNCVICQKYSSQSLIIAELDGITLTHLLPSPDGFAMRGRLVIEPKRHVVAPEDLSPQEFSQMGMLLQKGMTLLKNALGAEHVYFFRINDQVPHFHFHLVPRYPETPKDFWGLKIIDWPKYPKANVAEINELSELLRERT